MCIYVDNRLLSLLIENEEQCMRLSEICIKLGFPLEHITLDRANLLYLLGFEYLYKNNVQWGRQHPLYLHILEVLELPAQEIAIYQNLFDQVFVDSLTKVKSWMPPDAQLLVNKLDCLVLSKPIKEWISPSLLAFKSDLFSNFGHTMHDLTLYLAWNKICTNMRILFDDQAINDRYAGLTTFKDCLFESFSHILQTGRTSPSLLRLMEAAFAFSMREEKLQRYPEEEWQLLCRAAAVLRPEDELCSVLYLDKLMTQNDGDKGLEIAKIFTFDTLNTVTAGIDFAKYIVDKHISTKVLCSLGVFCLSTQNKVLSLTSHILR